MLITLIDSKTFWAPIWFDKFQKFVQQNDVFEIQTFFEILKKNFTNWIEENDLLQNWMKINESSRRLVFTKNFIDGWVDSNSLGWSSPRAFLLLRDSIMWSDEGSIWCNPMKFWWNFEFRDRFRQCGCLDFFFKDWNFKNMKGRDSGWVFRIQKFQHIFWMA